MDCREDAGGTFQVTLRLVRTDYTAPHRAAPSSLDPVRCSTNAWWSNSAIGSGVAAWDDTRRARGVDSNVAWALVRRTLLVEHHAARVFQRPCPDLADIAG